MIDDHDIELLSEIIARRGVDFVLEAARERNRTSEALTIVSNAGMHPIPHEFVTGDLFVASEGSLDFSSIASVHRELDSILFRLREKLFQKKWNRVYLIPFGHAVVNMNIKLLVYRLLRIETIDVFHFGEGTYGLLERDTRRTLAAAPKLR